MLYNINLKKNLISNSQLNIKALKKFKRLITVEDMFEVSRQKCLF